MKTLSCLIMRLFRDDGSHIQNRDSMSDVIFEALEDLTERSSEQVKAYHDFLARFRGIE